MKLKKTFTNISKTKFAKRSSSIFEWLKMIGMELRFFPITIVIILLSYILLWQFPQTNDLILVLSESPAYLQAFFIFTVSIVVLAFLMSNINDYLRQVQNGLFSFSFQDRLEEALPNPKTPVNWESTLINYRDEETEQEYIQRLLPKVLGTLFLLIVALSLLNAHIKISGYKPEAMADYLLAGGVILLLLTLRRKTSNNMRKSLLGRFIKWLVGANPWIYGAIYLLTFPIVLVYNYRNGNSIYLLFVMYILLALGFFLISTSYSQKILKLKQNIGKWVIAACIFIAFILYFIILFDPGAAAKINTLTVIFTSFIGLFTIAVILAAFGKKTGIPFLATTIFVLFVSGILVSKLSCFRHYEVTNTLSTEKIDNRPDLDDYITNWINDRKHYIQALDSTEKYPVIFVAAEGGGSRAGLWSLLINSRLYEIDSTYFEKYLFSMTGASGGGGGNAVFYTTAYNSFQKKEYYDFRLPKEDSSILNYKGSKFYNENYLSSSVASFLGRDLLHSTVLFFRKNIPDRAELLEKEWGENYKEIFQHGEGKNRLDNEYLSLSVKKGNLQQTPPMLIMNTTHLQSGNYYTISPVKLNSNNMKGVFGDFLKEYDKAYKNGKQYEETEKTKTIKVSTAMLLNARFPYISPVGRVPEVGQFADAGYYDNIGGTVTLKLVEAFDNVAENKYPEIYDKLDIRVLIIKNSEDQRLPDDKYKCKSQTKDEDSIKFSTQFKAPLSVATSAIFAHPNELIRKYPQFIIESRRTPINRKREKDFMGRPLPNKEIVPVLPLSRYMPRSTIQSLEARLECEDVESKLQKLLSAEKQ